MAEKFSLVDLVKNRVGNREPLPEIEWVRFDEPTTVEGRIVSVNIKWSEDREGRKRRRATIILETENGERLGISGTWSTFVRLVRRANLTKDDYVRVTYKGTLAQLEVLDPEYARLFKEAYEDYMEYLKRQGRPIKYTKAPPLTKVFEIEVLSRAPRQEEENLEEIKEEIEKLEE